MCSLILKTSDAACRRCKSILINIFKKKGLKMTNPSQERFTENQKTWLGTLAGRITFPNMLLCVCVSVLIF